MKTTKRPHCDGSGWFTVADYPHSYDIPCAVCNEDGHKPKPVQTTIAEASAAADRGERVNFEGHDPILWEPREPDGFWLGIGGMVVLIIVIAVIIRATT